MQRVSTTVVAVIGGSPAALDALGGAANVAVAATPPDLVGMEGAVWAWRRATATSRAYFVHDADPLGRVADTWVRRFDQEEPPGALEVAVTEALRRWRAGDVELPDYYLLVDPEPWPGTWRHWFLGVLAGAAPARVVVVPDARDLAGPLTRLATGPWWPGLDRLLAGIDQVVPDREGPTQVSPGRAGARAAEGLIARP
ncbi:MAG TPA: hypothetical protein VE152_00735 [Acidimicrobiales bacterium]|jgi:hypothetical protein|nr:hypothetical protein [Acidimicrobiales bacterium]